MPTTHPHAALVGYATGTARLAAPLTVSLPTRYTPLPQGHTGMVQGYTTRLLAGDEDLDTRYLLALRRRRGGQYKAGWLAPLAAAHTPGTGTLTAPARHLRGNLGYPHAVHAAAAVAAVELRYARTQLAQQWRRAGAGGVWPVPAPYSGTHLYRLAIAAADDGEQGNTLAALCEGTARYVHAVRNATHFLQCGTPLPPYIGCAGGTAHAGWQGYLAACWAATVDSPRGMYLPHNAG